MNTLDAIKQHAQLALEMLEEPIREGDGMVARANLHKILERCRPLGIGDRVVLNATISPKYLRGLPATIVDTDPREPERVRIDIDPDHAHRTGRYSARGLCVHVGGLDRTEEP